MSRHLQSLLPWSTRGASDVDAVLEDALQRTPPTSFPELMALYRSVLPALRPARKLSSAQQARIDGLIMAVLVLDGWLETPERIARGLPPRIPAEELAELRVDASHFAEQRVDFAWRRLTERYGRRVRDLLKGSALLGKPWIGGLRYRFAIARIEQILRAVQVDPALAYRGMPALTPLAVLRILWRTISKRR